MINFKAKTPDGEIIKSALSSFTFPAGEAHTKREEQRELESIEIAILQPCPDSLHTDLFQLAMWNDYIKIENADSPPNGLSKQILVIPYFPGARADRGQPFGLGVYADFIRNMELDQIVIFDPHSPWTGDTLHAAANSVDFVYSDELLGKSYIKEQLGHYDGVIAPDAGAAKRAFTVSSALGTKFYQAEKTRDFETGKLSGFKLEGLPKDGKYLIVDDICDRGGTFKGLATELFLHPDQLDLFVSHGVFSHDAAIELPTYFGRIFTTNSYDPGRMLNANFTRLDIIHLLLERI